MWGCIPVIGSLEVAQEVAEVVQEALRNVTAHPGLVREEEHHHILHHAIGHLTTARFTMNITTPNSGASHAAVTATARHR